MATVTNITSVEQFNQLVDNASNTTLVALNFHAPWAAPCAQMNQVFETLAKQSSPQSTLFIAIDAEEHPDISESYEVSAVPYFVLLKAKVALDKISGADPTKLSQLITIHSEESTTFSLPPAQTATATPQVETNGDGAAEVEEDINTRLAKLVKAAPVMLFMKGTPAAPQCGFSRQLVALLREKSVRYGFFNILADDEVRQELKVFSDWPTYPQLYVQGELIGGLDIVKEEFENDPDFLSNLSSA
ncbi:thioredoxin-like protein [Trichophaea hybrida]|nr:thioredoxin-like protein [Trichophaea hybrida]